MELSLCNKLNIYNPYIFATQCRRPKKFQAKNSVESTNLSLKYQRFTPLGYSYTGIRNLSLCQRLNSFIRKCNTK